MIQDSAKNFVDLAAKTVAVQLRIARQCFDMYQQLISKTRSPDSGQGADFATRLCKDSVDLIREWTNANVNCWKNATDFVISRNRGFTESFFNPQAATEQRAKDVETPQSPASDHRARRVDVVMRGTVGNESCRMITLQNPYESQVEVSFLVSEFSGLDGSSFRANIRFEPEKFVLSAGEERSVSIRVLLAPETFIENETYLASVIVRGCNNLELILRVHACAASSGVSQSAAEWTYSTPPMESEPERNLTQEAPMTAPHQNATASRRKKSAKPRRQKGSGDAR